MGPLVEYQDSVSPVEKLYFLKTSLAGPAAQLIIRVPLTTDQFEPASANISTQFNQLLYIFPVAPRLLTQLNELFSSVQDAFYALEALSSQLDLAESKLLAYLLITSLTYQIGSNRRSSWDFPPIISHSRNLKSF